MADLHTPHDRFFKQTFARPDLARDFLRTYLPAEVAARLRLDTLELQQGTFVDPELRQHFSDLLYRVQLEGGDDAYLYVLFEHKSYPEPLTAFQLLRYLVHIWDRDLRRRGGTQLAPIVPLVVYHGRTSWNVALQLQELVVAPEALRRYLPAFAYHVCDLTAYSDEEIAGEVLLQATLLTLKYVFTDELASRLPDVVTLVRDLADQETALGYLETLLRYLSAATEHVTEADLRQAVETAFPDTGGELMATIAERWHQEGLQKGRQEGRRQDILRVLELRFGTVPDEVASRVAALEDLTVLDRLHEQAVLAESLDAFTETLDAHSGA